MRGGERFRLSVAASRPRRRRAAATFSTARFYPRRRSARNKMIAGGARAPRSTPAARRFAFHVAIGPSAGRCSGKSSEHERLRIKFRESHARARENVGARLARASTCGPTSAQGAPSFSRARPRRVRRATPRSQARLPPRSSRRRARAALAGDTAVLRRPARRARGALRLQGARPGARARRAARPRALYGPRSRDVTARASRSRVRAQRGFCATRRGMWVTWNWRLFYYTRARRFPDAPLDAAAKRARPVGPSSKGRSAGWPRVRDRATQDGRARACGSAPAGSPRKISIDHHRMLLGLGGWRREMKGAPSSRARAREFSVMATVALRLMGAAAQAPRRHVAPRCDAASLR